MKLEYLPKVKGIYKHMYPLANLTRLKVGGIADVLFIPKDINDLALFLSNIPNDIPITTIGAGSNILIRDKGIRGIVIKLGNSFNTINIKNNILTVGAATLNNNLAYFCYQNNIGGIEFIIGIPGSIGGSTIMNAGCFGKEFKDIVTKIELVSKEGKIYFLHKDEIKFNYRYTSIPVDSIITTVQIQGYYEKQDKIKDTINIFKFQKEKTQPLYAKTAGSTFKNPANHKAWKLIEQTGLSGARLGGAQLSEVHCNFLINSNNATAYDIEQLGLLAQKKVLKQNGILLEWEIKRIGGN